MERYELLDIRKYWEVILKQDIQAMKYYFRPDAQIRWHNTNELFSVDEFIRANCEYLGEWCGELEKLIEKDDLVICVVHVYSKDDLLHFHVTSFIKINGGLIQSIDEYWGDDGEAPQWRLDKKIGRKIK